MKAKPRKSTAVARIVPTGTLKNMRQASRQSQGNPINHALDSQAILRDLMPGYGNALRMPELPPGVIPAKPPLGDKLVLAMDNGVREMASRFIEHRRALWVGQHQFCVRVFLPRLPVLGTVAANRGVSRAVRKLQAAEMTRRWVVKLKVTDKKKKKTAPRKMAQDEGKPGETATEDNSNPLDDKVTEITQAMEDFKLRDHFRTCINYDGQFGRGQLYIRIKGQEDDLKRQAPLEITPKNIPKGSLLGFQPIEPYWTTPYSYNATDPTRPDF